MWKIIKKSVEKITVNKEKFTLWMKWEFKIEFANDSFGPYNYKFEREDCYFSDGLSDRGTKIFPLLNKQFDNTEIFLETDDIVVAVWERWSLMWGDKTFIDVINFKTENKQRIFTDEVNIIYNSEKSIIINCKIEWKFKTLVLDFETMEINEEKEEEMQTFFKCIYNVWEKQWYLLDFNVSDINKKDEEKKYQKWTFSLKKISTKWTPKSFDRETFVVETDKLAVDVWEESKK